MNTKKLFNTAKKYLTDSDYRFLLNARFGLYDNMPDEEYIKKLFRIKMGKTLDLDNPITFNEKLQWLKLYDRKPEYSVMVDKYEAKKYVAERIGEEYIIPTLGVWDNPDDIDFDKLPDKFVLKCTHNSGVGMYICTDKSTLNKEEVCSDLQKGLKQNYYLTGREWPYKNVKPRIIAEQYITDSDDSSELTDYKFFCFDGCVDCVMICLDRSTGDTKFYFFDKEWQLKRINIRGKNAPEGFTVPKPECMDDMFSIAEKLSAGFRFMRVDLYASCGKIYFGEMTFFPTSGFDKNLLDETDNYWGGLIKI